MPYSSDWGLQNRKRLDGRAGRARRKNSDPWGYWAIKKRAALKTRAKGEPMATVSELLGLAEKQNYCCALTGWKLEEAEAVVDHISPVYEGGKHTIDNLQLLHFQINEAKGSIPQDRFISLCKAVAQHNTCN